MKNSEVAKILREIGEYLAMEGVAFKPRAYENAADAILELKEDILDVYKSGGLKALEEIPGVGVSIAEKIEEFIRTGHMKYYESFKKKTPIDLDSLEKVGGLGPKTIKVLYETGLFSQRELARDFGVSRRTIQFIINPEKREQNYQRRVERGGSKQYYDREKNTKAMKVHRDHKRDLLAEKKLKKS